METFNLKAAIEYQLKNCMLPILTVHCVYGAYGHVCVCTAVFLCVVSVSVCVCAFACVCVWLCVVVCVWLCVYVFQVIYLPCATDDTAREALTDMPPRSEEVCRKCTYDMTYVVHSCFLGNSRSLIP